MGWLFWWVILRHFLTEKTIILLIYQGSCIKYLVLDILFIFYFKYVRKNFPKRLAALKKFNGQDNFRDKVY